MFKCILAAVLAVFTVASYSQIAFEKGYFIDESGRRIDCLIKNVDWKDNPSQFDYKLSQDDSVKRTSIRSVKEFGVSGISKYIRADVKIDRSPEEVHNLNQDRQPIFAQEQLFLKMLVEGKASLLLYEDGNLVRFFYKTDNSEIQQLVYKSYITPERNIGYNSNFRQQLFNDLKCEGITIADFKSLNYKIKELVKSFTNYNKCADPEFVHIESKQRKDLFNLSLRPGLSQNSFSVESSTFDTRNRNFESSVNFRFGVEVEFILPYNKNKWGIIIEPTWRDFKSEGIIEDKNVSGGIIISKVNYQSIELPLGIRHYFFLNSRSTIFANASFLFDFANSESSVEFLRANGSVLTSLDVKSRNNMAFGAGYKHGGKYGIEVRYQTNREILSDYLYWTSDFGTISVILGYSLF